MNIGVGWALLGDWSYPTAIRFGTGRVEELAEACAKIGIARPLLITDPGLAESDMVQNALSLCTDAGLPAASFSDVAANPVSANVADAVAVYRAGNHDGIIAFGGGSAMDVAKATALMAGQHRPIWDFEDREDWYLRADADAIAPVVAVPTTAGTGSEVGRVAVITDESARCKKLIFHPKLMPGAVILDPALTLSLPADLTAATGMDALAHNLEAYCARGFHPMADGMALEGMRLIKEWLPTAVADGSDISARAHMLVASMMGATAFQKGLGAIHALSHPVGALYNAHHGLTNAIFMPYVLAFNRQDIEAPLTRLASHLGLPGSGADGLIQWVLELRQEIGIPHSLADLGVEESGVDELVALAEIDQARACNPRPLSRQDLAQLYIVAIRGEMPGS
ncbi:MAG: iron-containing alcohol dehydrogenase [Rhodospirillaceae bacterium]|nr:iron-containing alcohol dehydrogenase [Rhodospirillaceae bacterium]